MPSKQDLEPLLNTSQNQLNLVFSRGGTLDSKNLALLALNVAVLIFVAQEKFTVHSGWIFLFVVTYLVSILANIAAIWPRNYLGASVELDDHPEYLTMAEDDLVLQLIADTRYALSYNQRMNGRKLTLCLASLGLSAAGTIVMLLCIINS